jgi:hypothetical protein
MFKDLKNESYELADKLENFTANDDFAILTRAAQAIRALNAQNKEMQFKAAGYETIYLGEAK